MNIFEYAVNLELDAQRYYLRQAEINEGNSIKAIFQMLAKDEEHHAEIIRKHIDEKYYELKSNNTLSESKSIFSEIEDYKNEIRLIPSQLDAYRVALDMEKNSMELYDNYLSNSSILKEREILKYLVEQEKEHYSIINELITLVSRPENWVEAAEFGTREEY